MLQGIPKILSPALLKLLCEIERGDRIVIGDGIFLAESMGRDADAEGEIDRFVFYYEAKKRYAIISTDEGILMPILCFRRELLREACNLY